MHRRFAPLCLALGLVAGLAAPALAQTASIGQAKIAVLDVRRILADSTAGKNALAKLKKLQEDKEAEGRTKQQELADLENKIKTGRLSLTEDKLAQMQREYEDKTLSMRRFQDDANRDLAKARDDAFAEIERGVMPIIDQVGREMGLTLIFNKFEAGLVYADEGVDITEAVLQRFNSQTK